jgi:MoaA/NifB/PqqE/SkfB family radical SAM enzyme
MLKGISAWLKKRIQGRMFEAIQIEVTTRCTNRCVMCPRTVLANEWPEMDLAWEAFERLAAAFDRAQHVHLQGWGEPLLHPRIFNMIAAAKGAGCRVGLTTNGTLLDSGTSQGLLDVGLDLIAISIAGATRETHESIRVGSDFPLILENVRRFVSLRAGQGRKPPKVEFSYLMTKTNMAELPKAVELAASLGVDELYAINLDYVVTREHEDLKAFGCPELREGFMHILDEARTIARRSGITFRPYPLDPVEAAICEGNPLKILFVACDGWVSPCTYLGLSGRTSILRYFEGRAITVPRLRFGNVMHQDLLDIWNGPAYQAFRQQFARRRLEVGARALHAVTGEVGTSDQELPPPPEPCLTCYKLHGL